MRTAASTTNAVGPPIGAGNPAHAATADNRATRRSRRGEAGSRVGALLVLLAAGAFALSGCGSGGTKTVSVSSARTPATTAQSTVRARTTQSVPTPTVATTSTPTTTTPPVTETTRTTTAPAFTKQSSGAEGLTEAVSVVKAHGYTVADTSDYHPEQALRVLVGTREGSTDGHGQQAFFFVNGHYLGTDAKQPSATVEVVGQGDTEVTLAYPLYRPHDSLCCPGGGQATVRFQLNNGQLVALNPIPPVSSQTGLSRQ
jgi:hypothetical protein